MGESIRLGRIAGIPVGINWSLLFIFGLIAWSIAGVYLPEASSGYSTAAYWIVALPVAVLFYASLLAHELAHSVVARHSGVPVRSITLWLFGGVSKLEGEAATAGDLFRLAIAGPLMSVALGVGFVTLAALIALVSGPELLIAAAAWLGVINLFLALFNLIPAAPLDGGRVLAALLWRHHGDRVRAAVSAAQAGTAFAYVLVAFGVVVFLAGDGIGGLWLVLLGWFLLAASRAEASNVLLRDALAGVTVADVMSPHPVAAPASLSVEAFLHEFALRHHFSSFPLEAADGTLVGLVTLSRVKTVPAEQRPFVTVRDIACPIAEVPTATPEEPVVDLLRRMSGTPDGRALVIVDRHVVGVVSPSDISRAVSLAAFRAPRPAEPTGSAHTRGES